MTFDPFTMSEVFQKFYSNLANKFGLYSVEVYYKNVLQLQENKFIFHTIESNSVLKLLKNVEVNKAAGIDNISRRFLKDILAIYISHSSNPNLQFIY